jgi:hypothetical protein
MAFRNADAEKSLAYNDGIDYLVGGNSVVFGQGDLLSQSTEFAIEATAGSTIIGVCLAEKTMASDNQTVARVKVGYTPLSTKNTYTLPIAGTSLVFAGDLVASNVVNLNVNGVAMTPITYDTSNNNTLDLIAAQLQTQFPSVIASATRSGTRTVVINTVGKMSSVVLTGILVTLGASQTTGVQTSLISTGDIGKFYDIVTATQFVDAATENASSGQLKLENYSSGDFGDFSIANT